MAGHEEIIWRKSTRSEAGNCVEVAVRADAAVVLIRDSRNPGGTVLEFDRQAFGEFISCLKGEGRWV